MNFDIILIDNFDGSEQVVGYHVGYPEAILAAAAAVNAASFVGAHIASSMHTPRWAVALDRNGERQGTWDQAEMADHIAELRRMVGA